MNFINETQTTIYNKIAKAIGYIKAHQSEQPSLAQVAGQVGMSPYHFQRLFTQWAGVSPKKFLQYLTLQYAKERLKAQENLLHTTYEVGLSSISRLHNLFITLEGITPGEYRSRGDKLQISYGFFESPFGRYILGVSQDRVCHLAFYEEEPWAVQHLQDQWPLSQLVFAPKQLFSLQKQLFSSSNQHPANLPLLVKGTPFQIKVWEALLKIPPGHLASYDQMARLVQQPLACRAVGSAVGNNPIGYLIPCHRVIKKAGDIGEYHWGSTRKIAIIGWEAVKSNDL
jgi:AraC family transcriptional regulator, regulatory protein of adaptative response / methylated-DNA-[protein]-cysteine methyltransferase